MNDTDRPMTRDELINAQSKLCRESEWPMFAPHSGICFNCRKDIVNPSWAKIHITGCPRCRASFCE